MYILNNRWLYLLLNLGIITLLFFISAPTYNLENYINSLFYFFLLYLVIVLFLFIKKGGFFDGVTFAFRRFGSIMSKNKDYLEEWREKPAPSEKVNMTFYLSLPFQTIALFVILVLLLVLYYFI